MEKPKFKTYVCSKCDKDRIPRDIIYRIPKDDCSTCPDWNICIACFNELDSESKKRIKDNPNAQKTGRWE